MKAMVIPAFGAPDVFELRDVPVPAPGPGELLVRVRATSVNPVDAKIRADGTWAGIKPPAILGYDAAGVVEQLGANVEEFRIGDEVYFTPEIFGNNDGTYAEYHAVPARIVAHKPKNVAFEEAAAVPLAGGTAWEAVVRRLAVRVGETILIHGGAGGVGSFAVQFAKLAGARVFATAGTENQAVLKRLGVDVAIDYKTGDFAETVMGETDGKGVDAVFDTATGDLVGKSCAVTRPFGRLATILAPGGDLSSISYKNLTLHGIFLTRERKRLEEIGRLLDDGRVRPLIAETWPLERVADAHERMDSGHGAGKIVLLPK